MQPYILEFHQQSTTPTTDAQAASANLLSPQPSKLRLSNTFSSPVPIPHSPHHNLYVSPMSKSVASRVHTLSHTTSTSLTRASTVPFVAPSPTSAQAHTNASTTHTSLQHAHTFTAPSVTSSTSVPSLISNTPRSTKLFSFGQSPAQVIESSFFFFCFFFFCFFFSCFKIC
jgi:hypothetical protein